MIYSCDLNSIQHVFSIKYFIMYFIIIVYFIVLVRLLCIRSVINYAWNSTATLAYLAQNSIGSHQYNLDERKREFSLNPTYEEKSLVKWAPWLCLQVFQVWKCATYCNHWYILCTLYSTQTVKQDTWIPLSTSFSFTYTFTLMNMSPKCP